MRTKPSWIRGLPAAVGALLLAQGCGNSAAVRIGIITDCGAGGYSNQFARFQPPEIAGAELPLIQRGARLTGATPSEGIEGGSVGGRPVKLEILCAQSFNPRSVLTQLRSLVETRHVAAVVGPTHEDDSLEARYARKHPGVVFMLAGYGQSTTLRSRTPNMFRFELDGSQESAGLASYAYRHGWRRVTTIGEGDPEGWSDASGFNAEFCALGGHVKRLWAPGSEEHLARLVSKVSPHTDGVFLAPAVYTTTGFVRRWAARHQDLSRRLVVGWSAAGDLSTNPLRRAAGVAAVSSWPWTTTRAFHDYQTRFENAFSPTIPDFGTGLTYYDEVEPLLEALEKVHGDTSNGERSLQQTLANLHYHSPEGPIHLDPRNQAIGPTYLGRMRGDGSVRQIAVIPNVDETFGGYLDPHSTPPGPHSPHCVKRPPPRWAQPTR